MDKLASFKNLILSVTEADELIDALNTERQTSIRINPLKMSGLKLPNVPWCENGFYVEKRPIFTLDPRFHSGQYYVQEASSMFLEQVVKPLATRQLRVLDLCAAPGGKSTLLLSLLTPDSLLVANEVIRSRSQILSENIQKWGFQNCIVTNNDPKDFSSLRGYFDLILVDAPCSGEGMFRKDDKAFEEWSPEHVDLCSKRQYRILSDIWDCLAPNGTLIYSTCTFNESENEDVVSRFVTENSAQCKRVLLQKEWNITEREKANAISYRFFPHKTKGEGFSVSVIEKKDGPEFSYSKKISLPKEFAILSNKKSIEFYPYIKNREDCIFSDWKNRVFSVSKHIEFDFQTLASKCSVVHAGMPIAEQIGNKINPLSSLAFSINYSNCLPTESVDLPTAVRYFKKETISLPSSQKGWICLEFQEKPIGFVKNIGNRANNSYPQEWAIKMNVDYDKLELPF